MEGDRRAAPSPTGLTFLGQQRAAANVPGVPLRIEAGEDFSNDFARVRVEARETYGGSERLALLKWVDARGQMMRPGLHALDPMWLGAASDYYDSGKLIMLARKGLRAGGSSTACIMLTRCAAFTPRRLDAGTIGVIPIMSATRDEADGRFVTIRSCLRAIGMRPPQKGKHKIDNDLGTAEDEDGVTYEVPAGGIAGTFQSKRSATGGGIIAILDAQGNRIQFKILPALVRHGVGYTGVAGFADESDLWPNDPEHHVNPAERIYDRISERFTTTWPGAEFLIFSASYLPDTAHKRAIDDVILSERGLRPHGREPVMDTDLVHLARLGVEGARRDENARRHLARLLGGTPDPRLLAPGDPMSPDLPTWVYNPSEDIEKCYRFAKRSIGGMLGRYGGRASENREGTTLDVLADVEFPWGDSLTRLDTVIGLAPSEGGGEWGIVLVTFDGGRFIVAADVSGHMTSDNATTIVVGIAADYRASVIAAHAAHRQRIEAQLLARVQATGWAPPLAPVNVYDGDTLRLGPLRARYLGGRIAHVEGLGELEAAARAWSPKAPRSPRLEALAAAVERLGQCYPWTAQPVPGAHPQGPAPVDSMLSRGEGPRAMLERLGARVGRDDVLR